jgi:hypothetical protein
MALLIVCSAYGLGFCLGVGHWYMDNRRAAAQLPQSGEEGKALIEVLDR